VLQAHGLRSGYFRGNVTTYDTTLGDVLDSMHDRAIPTARSHVGVHRPSGPCDGRVDPPTALSIPTPPVRRIG
jgi:hypothetical protein